MDDPVYTAENLAEWDIVDGASLTQDATYECDVVVIGTGAGGGVTADILAAAGYAVIMVEQGPLNLAADFTMREQQVYPKLYQDSIARKSKDGAISIFQGRTVGGSTVVNWTTSFRTPADTLAYWRSQHQLDAMTQAQLRPWFERLEAQLSITPWAQTPNRNNQILQEGAAKLGIATGVIARNVKDCANLGYCGLGCPIHAKQSMLVTTIPSALRNQAKLICSTLADHFVIEHDRIQALVCKTQAPRNALASGVRVQLRAKHYVLAAGGIGTPGVLLRSKVADPYGLVGKRTFIHPTIASAAIFDTPVNGFAGAPQSIYSDHFLASPQLQGPIGYKLEVPPLYPMLLATSLPGIDVEHATHMQNFANMNVIIALLRDGFHPHSVGGKVELLADGSPILDYRYTDYLVEGMRRAYQSMAQIQFAAGAQQVIPFHEDGLVFRDWDAAQRHLANLPIQAFRNKLFSAHVMGGCAMGATQRDGVVDQAGRSFGLENLSIHDGSVFPTSLGANPQLSIYALAARNATQLAQSLGAVAVTG